MFKIIVISDSYSHFDGPIKEYFNRLKNISIIKIKPEKGKKIDIIIKKETEKIKNFLEKERGYNIYLDINGSYVSTEDLFNFIENLKQSNSKINFIIGGAYGINLNILDKYINKKISLSKLTLPHNLAFLVLLEQLYRIETIKNGSGYHH